MNQLHIYPTSRALREVSSHYKEQEGFLPTLMRMDEFESRAILMKNKILIDPLQRILLLKEATNFKAFASLKINRELVRFFTKSEALFRFFEELAGEKIGFEVLAEADAYAEFTTHLNILEQLLHRYKQLLDSRGLTDKLFLPAHYEINHGFIESYTTMALHLEGYLSHFELDLLERVAQHTSLTIHYTTSPFNLKMQERFKQYGVDIPNHAHSIFDFSTKQVLEVVPNHDRIDAKVLCVEEREEQVAVAFEQIDSMVQQGINPENITLILPDEAFKEHFMLFDTHNNLNFAMGYDYSNGSVYKSLEALYQYWQTFDNESRKLLERYGLVLETIEKISSIQTVKAEAFFECIDGLGLHESPLKGGERKEKFKEHVYEAYIHFVKVLESESLTYKAWLFLWLKRLSQVTHDDVRGGKITVMGVLETRGVQFEGVVIVDFNEGVVPAVSSKDQFLNSSVRAFANLPTKHDRESLQKQYYKRLLEQTSHAVILYSSSNNKLPSKFLYELGVGKAEQTKAQLDLLYNQPSQLIEIPEPIVKEFDATAIVWSASRLKTYLECKRKYYYRYIQKIEAKKETERNEGAFLHRMLESLYQKQDYFKHEEEMQKSIDTLLEELLPFDDAKTAYQKLLWREKLKGFVVSQIEHFKAEWRVIAREQEFQGEIGGLRFKGRIDRIDQNKTDTLVLDYKSGRVEKEPTKLNRDKLTDFQMSVYHQLLIGKYQNIQLAFVKLFEKGALQEVTLLAERNALLFEHIIRLKQTKQFIAQKCDDLQRCKWCEFALICERGEYL